MLWETDAVAGTFEGFNLLSICFGDAGELSQIERKTRR